MESSDEPGSIGSFENSIIDYDSDFDQDINDQEESKIIENMIEEDWEIEKSFINPKLKQYVDQFENKVTAGLSEEIKREQFSPFDSFSLYFDTDLFTYIAKQSDCYINEKIYKEKTGLLYKYYADNIKEIDRDDIKAYLAIILLMGIKKYPDQYLHWSTEETFIDLKIRKIMPVTMYKILRAGFHLCDDHNIDANDPFYKVRYLLTYLNTKFSKNYIPTQHVALDESMIAFRGRVGFLFYIPSKPTKYGIKLHALCESSTGYCINAILDGGRKEQKLPNYTQNLAKNILRGLENKGFILYCDSWYSSVGLFEELVGLGIAATGMIRKDRVKIFSKLANELAESDCKFALKKNVNVMLWKEKKNEKN